jgi:hypothetical protein
VGLAFNSSGNLFEADAIFNTSGGGNIYEFTPDGVRTTFASGLDQPSGLTIDSAGDLFEADYTSRNVYRFTPGGAKSTFASRLLLVGLAFQPALWNPLTIQTSPRTQTAEAGTGVGLEVQASGTLLFCLWYFNYTNLISCSTNCELQLTNLQFSQSGAYTVVVTNVFEAATSSPVMLNVIPAVERRPVWGVKVTGQIASLLNVDYAGFLSRAPTWTTLGSVSLTSTSQYYFDLTLPLPPQRFYRAWQTGASGVVPPLDLHLVPAITLTGSIGGSVRVDAINQFGPADAWGTLATVVMTNTSQLYFDTSSVGQPARLWRIVQLP